MNINLISHTTNIASGFIQASLDHVPLKKIALVALITLVGLAALCCLTAILSVLSFFNFFDQDEHLFNIHSEDLRDKVLEEQGEDAYHQEVANIKTLKESFKKQDKPFSELLKEKYPPFGEIHPVNRLIPVGESYRENCSAVMYQALEVRQAYKNTHYTFLHGRALEWKVFSCFCKSLIQTFKPDLSLKMMKFLRAPFTHHIAENASDFIKKYPHVNDDVAHYRTQLISADAFWLSCRSSESAMSFFTSNYNIASGAFDACRPIIASCLDESIPGRKELINSSVKKIAAVIKNIRMEMDACKPFPGELLVICIPKTIVQDPHTNPVYQASAFGIPACSHTIDIPLLEELQNDNVPKVVPKVGSEEDMDVEDVYENDTDENPHIEDEDSIPSSPKVENLVDPLVEKFVQTFVDPLVGRFDFPQYRILASHLLPKNGVRIFGFNALTKDMKKKYHDPIQEIVKEIYTAAIQGEKR